MEFSEVIKQLRKEKGLTQEELAKSLNVTRQAISNWENDKNLPDIETIIYISKTYKVSLDKLILGEENMNKIEEKLIDDGSIGKQVKRYTITNIIGFAFCVLGVLTIILKGLTIEYIDEVGILHENFFLIVVGFTFIIIGILIEIVNVISHYVKTTNKSNLLSSMGLIVFIVALMLMMLIYSNSNRFSIPSLIISLVGIVMVVLGRAKNR